jgi:hypothetical protein
LANYVDDLISKKRALHKISRCSGQYIILPIRMHNPRIPYPSEFLPKIPVSTSVS